MEILLDDISSEVNFCNLCKCVHTKAHKGLKRRRCLWKRLVWSSPKPGWKARAMLKLGQSGVLVQLEKLKGGQVDPLFAFEKGPPVGRHKAREMFLHFKPEKTGLCCN